MVKLDTLSQLMKEHQIVYTFLQRIYEKEIDQKLLAEMPQKMKPLLAINEMLSNAESQKAIKELVKFSDSISSQEPDSVKTLLAVDYARLFLSIYKVPPHPSESTYREGTMMQHYRDEVLKTYWSFGVSAKKDFTEPEDHIATELSFMAYLCQKAAYTLNSGDHKESRRYIQAQKDFLEMHLTKWVPKLVKDIFDTAQTPFYKGIAILTKEFIDLNLSNIDDIVKQLRG